MWTKTFLVSLNRIESEYKTQVYTTFSYNLWNSYKHTIGLIQNNAGFHIKDTFINNKSLLPNTHIKRYTDFYILLGGICSILPF